MSESDNEATINEAADSTVDDWHGQEVQRDVDVADQAVEDADGDMAEAEQLFEERRPEHPSDQFKVDAAEREGTLPAPGPSNDHPTGEAMAQHNAEVDPPA